MVLVLSFSFVVHTVLIMSLASVGVCPISFCVCGHKLAIGFAFSGIKQKSAVAATTATISTTTEYI
jgi:hypothetical protein